MIRSAMIALALVAGFGVAAHADVVVKSQDGSMELTLPSGWKEVPPRGPNTKLQASDGHGASIAVSAQAKEDFKDLEAFTNFVIEKMKKTLPGAEAKVETVQIDGKPAKRMTMSGTLANGQNASVVVTCMEAGSQFLRVMVHASASNFARQGPVLIGLANQIKVTTVAAAPAQPAQPAQPAKPAPKH